MFLQVHLKLWCHFTEFPMLLLLPGILCLVTLNTFSHLLHLKQLWRPLLHLKQLWRPIYLTPSPHGPEDFWATLCMPYAQAWKISRPLVKCTFGFVVEGKRLLQAYTWQLDWPPISSSFMAAWERIFLQQFFRVGEWGWVGGVVISGSWLLIKEGIVYILLHVKFWMRFWIMLVMMMKHLYNSQERRGEEEDGDIFPK